MTFGAPGPSEHLSPLDISGARTGRWAGADGRSNAAGAEQQRRQGKPSALHRLGSALKRSSHGRTSSMRSSTSVSSVHGFGTNGMGGSVRRRPDRRYFAFTSIFFCCFTASAVLGRVSKRTPAENEASILSRSMPSGSVKVRWKEP